MENNNIENEIPSDSHKKPEDKKNDIFAVLKNETEQHEHIEYSAEDIISEEWICENFSILEKLFPLFQRAAFSQDDPRKYHQLHDDEKKIIDALLGQELSEMSKKNTTDNIGEHIAIFEGDNTVAINTIKDELDKLFGRGVSERYEKQFLRYYHFDPADEKSTTLDKETSKIGEVSHNIYKKLVLIGLYKKKELYIKTIDGKVVFTGPESAKDSIDGLLYYKDHQEKYGGENRHRFIEDSYSNTPPDTYIAIADIKISDLSYGAIQEVIGSLSKNEIAPTFSQVVSKSLLPKLGTGKKEDTKELE